KAIRALHQEATHVAETLETLQSDLRVSSSSELGIIGMILGTHREGAASMIAKSIGPILEYDKQYRTDLELTLSTYFSCGQVISDTARKIRVHPKTVSQRLDRIKTLLGPNSLK